MAITDCIKQVCDQADQTNNQISATSEELARFLRDVANGAGAFKCVINGPVGQVCISAGGRVHLTLAEALARLNAQSIASISRDSYVATAGQTAFTLAAAPASAAALEVELNGAICSTPTDYNAVGATLTFTAPLLAGDQVETRRFGL